jgi:hypothetical protein
MMRVCALTGQKDKDPAFQAVCSVLQHPSNAPNRSQVSQTHTLLDKIMNPILFQEKKNSKLVSTMMHRPGKSNKIKDSIQSKTFAMMKINKNLKRDQDADVLSFRRTNGGVVVIPDADAVVLFDQCLFGIIIISTSTSQELLLDEIDVGHARSTQVLQSLVGIAVAIVPAAI